MIICKLMSAILKTQRNIENGFIIDFFSIMGYSTIFSSNLIFVFVFLLFFVLF